ncbi:hypothetical protein M5J15_06235 [Serratia symbiotica]|uniref:hypothetical protein n=1 Tax=Serratia symbiotica TaxID=138074 RepID=UPI002090CEDB|nr:hypothetical protein [Serratia symbiotica]USS96486.1 hypothetical protein M5J15_06235 [Serratia symbiotica]
MKYTCHGPNSPRDEKGNCILSQAFSHDIFGNIIETQTHFDNGTSNFTMYSYADDNPTQLIHLCNSHPQYPSDIEFRYDAAGNLLVDEKGRVYTYNELGQMLNVEQQGQVLSQYRYNAQGKFISQTYGHENKVTSLKLYYQGEQLMNEYCHGIHTSYQGINGVVKGRVIHGSEGQHQLLFCNTLSFRQ